MSPFMIVILIAILSSANLEKEKPQAYCGRALANVRMLLCNEHIQKRSMDDHMTSKIYPSIFLYFYIVHAFLHRV